MSRRTTRDDTSPARDHLASVVDRYPEKTGILSGVFDETTNSYKLFWFMGILALLKRHHGPKIAVADILTEMLVLAWHPVCLFRLSLGRQDDLQRIVMDLQGSANLPPGVSVEEVRHAALRDPPTLAKLRRLKRYVPMRFLTPWFGSELAGLKDSVKDGLIIAMASASQGDSAPSPYFFDDDALAPSIVLNPAWLSFLMENMGALSAFVDHHLARYLESRNSGSPGIVNKLRRPEERDPWRGRQFWNAARARLGAAGVGHRLRDMYSERILDAKYSLDHFLPWSFVVHDSVWNLVPVDPATNSSKGDSLPDVDLYLPRLASIHHAAIHVLRGRPEMLQDHCDAFKQDERGLLAMSEEQLAAEYRSLIIPQRQLAENLGFRPGWRFARHDRPA